MSEKLRLTIYLTQETKTAVEQRADALGLSVSAYLTECTMWDRRNNLIPKLRKGWEGKDEIPAHAGTQ